MINGEVELSTPQKNRRGSSCLKDLKGRMVQYTLPFLRLTIPIMTCRAKARYITVHPCSFIPESTMKMMMAVDSRHDKNMQKHWPMILVLNMRDPALFRWSSTLDPHTTNNIKTNYVTSCCPLPKPDLRRCHLG